MAQGCTEVGRWLSGDLRTAMWYRRTVVLGEAHTTQELAPMSHRTFCAVVCGRFGSRLLHYYGRCGGARHERYAKCVSCVNREVAPTLKQRCFR